jgi:hypothetical protein
MESERYCTFRAKWCFKHRVTFQAANISTTILVLYEEFELAASVLRCANAKWGEKCFDASMLRLVLIEYEYNM